MRVIVEGKIENLDFIIYNVVFSMPQKRFTENSLIAELKKCGFSFSDVEVRQAVKRFYRQGLIKMEIFDYSLNLR